MSILDRFAKKGITLGHNSLRVSLIVVNYNGVKKLGKVFDLFIKSLLRTEYDNFEFREIIAEKGYEVIGGYIGEALGLLRDAGVRIVDDHHDLHGWLEIMESYRLLPNDAQIVLTCKHYGINTIATFDDDFRRVPWLHVVP